MLPKGSFISSFGSLLFLSLAVVGGALPPLNVGSVVTTCGENEPFFTCVPPSRSRNMLRVTGHSSALLSVLEDRESVDADSTEIIACHNMSPVFRGIDSVDIGSVCSLREHSCHLPSELASGRGPESRISHGGLTVSDLLALLHVVEDLRIGLINSSQEFGVNRPVHADDGRGVHEGDRPVQGVVACLRDLVDVD